MNRTTGTLLALVAPVLLLSFACAEGDVPGYPPDDVAEILVLGPGGEPVEAATVELLGEPAIVSETEPPEIAATGRTGPDGRARIPVLPLARYEVRVTRAPYATAGDVACFGGNVTTFRLAMPGRIHGVVRAAGSRDPIPGRRSMPSTSSSAGSSGRGP